MQNENYKRMAKNAALLYFRMLFKMGVMLYTSRVVLETLGVNDFGIYSVVAGFVMMLGFLNSAMSSSTQRFITFELGKLGGKNLPNIFSMSMNIHIIIAFIVVFFGETLGLWFLKTQLTIPNDRIIAATWVYHLSLLAFVMKIITVPYNALIIAYERMNVYATLSIIDVLLQLVIVLILGFIDIDKLVLYSLLILLVSIVFFILNLNYCKINFPESKFKFFWEKKLFDTLFSFTSWNLWGNIASIGSTQGINILLNIFFGPSVNAARSIATQLSIALNSFVHSLQIAVNPQIIKSYASNEILFMHRLVMYSAKYNFFLLLFISVPVLVNTDFVLKLWLGNVPIYTNIFVQLLIINTLIDCISAPLMTSAQATGKIKLYQSIVGGILLFNVPISYLILKVFDVPYYVVVVSIFISILAFIARLIIINKLMSLSIIDFLKEVVLRIILVTSVIYMFFYYISYNDFFDFITETVVMLVACIIIIFVLGLSRLEIKAFKSFIFSIYIKLKNKKE